MFLMLGWAVRVSCVDLRDLSKHCFEFLPVLYMVSQSKTDMTPIHPIRHPECHNCTFFFLIDNDLDVPEPNNTVFCHDCTTNGVFLTTMPICWQLNAEKFQLFDRKDGETWRV